MSRSWRVQASFYVDAESAAAAEAAVAQLLNSALVQHLIGERLGEVDVHAGETREWDWSG